MMDHPNIARVFDGGATETGRPYVSPQMDGARGIARSLRDCRSFRHHGRDWAVPGATGGGDYPGLVNTNNGEVSAVNLERERAGFARFFLPFVRRCGKILAFP